MLPAALNRPPVKMLPADTLAAEVILPVPVTCPAVVMLPPVTLPVTKSVVDPLMAPVTTRPPDQTVAIVTPLTLLTILPAADGIITRLLPLKI